MGDMHPGYHARRPVPLPLVTISAEEFEREWDRIWPDTDSADLAVRAAGLAARR
jgi:hypothetical protein